MPAAELVGDGALMNVLSGGAVGLTVICRAWPLETDASMTPGSPGTCGADACAVAFCTSADAALTASGMVAPAVGGNGPHVQAVYSTRIVHALA